MGDIEPTVSGAFAAWACCSGGVVVGGCSYRGVGSGYVVCRRCC